MTRIRELFTSRPARVGLLGTLIFHLVVAIALVGSHVTLADGGEEMVIVFEAPDEMVVEQEALQREATLRERADEEVREMLRSIAVNEEVAGRERSDGEEVARYVAGIREELVAAGEGRYAMTHDATRETDSLQAEEARRQRTLDSLQSTVYAGESSVSYKLTGRFKVWLQIPVFRCERGGTIVVDISVDTRGTVVKATVVDRESATDDCLREVAVDAASRSRFNADEGAPSPQRGTITYHFVRQ
ncbi:MAG: TonB family protein [Odoribacteraceae bacterium]|jgi:TonB family protein|nr:TonB family protein [Odoribacteraceae bacterium]